ncbi:hypothetical protein FRB93_000929 [Tulasnella sp. JGI-2019a]|nr:hypothetical protein FRB93_000929 [Tulasnella sp. JGI-2019a]
MLPTSRDEIFDLLKALGVEIHPKTTLSTEVLEGRLRKALDCVQYITDVISTPGGGALDLHGVEPWTCGDTYVATRRGSLGEAITNYTTQKWIPELYLNALMNLRQTVMSMASHFDNGCTRFCLQDENKESAIIIRILKVFEKHETVPVFMVFYVHGTKENPKGIEWIQYQVRQGSKEQPLMGVTCTLTEQQLLLRILEMNSKRVPASYTSKRGPREQDFTLSFILPVGPLDSKDLGCLNINDGCVVCGKPGDKRCASCVAIYYCSRECQRADWSDHKSTCKTLKDATWISIRFCVVPPDFPSGGAHSVLNFKGHISGRPNQIPKAKTSTPKAPPNTQGTKPFIVKIQCNGSNATQMMIYDRRRTCDVLYLKSKEDAGEVAKFDAVARVVGFNTAWNGVKLFCWARRTGEWQFDLALDKLPNQDVKW